MPINALCNTVEAQLIYSHSCVNPRGSLVCNMFVLFVEDM